jgi:phosphonopyruvate decarboxylase
MPAIGVQTPANRRHIVLNNSSHDSVGGQPTIAGLFDLSGIARSAGYKKVYTVKTREELGKALAEKDKPLFIEIAVRKGNRKDLGRPKSSPQENKEAFMRFLSGGG